MIPFGPWAPDAAGINTPVLREARNALPAVGGFKPLPAPVVSTNPLENACQGAVVVVKDDGNAVQYAGDASELYKLTAGIWNPVGAGEIPLLDGDGNPILDDHGVAMTVTDVTSYSTAVGERWRFILFGTSLIATNYTDNVQYVSVIGSGDFADLPGSPPKARFIDIVRDQVWLGAINGNERRVAWSGINDATFWTFGTNSSDYQDAAAGGPIKGLIGGAQGYIFQAQHVTRATFTPGSTAVYQFDEVQGGKGIAASNSLVRVGDLAWYFSTDGFYKFQISSGATQPIGVGKWRKFFLDDMRAGTELQMLGAADPVNPVILWAYISRDNGTLIPDRVLIYDWVLDEAAFTDLSVEALTTWITSGVTLDTMNSFGNMETLQFSLDSPYWKGGASLLGIFGTDHALSHLQGRAQQATFITADGKQNSRFLITGTVPAIDTASVTVAIAARERDGDTVSFGTLESLEDTGEAPAFASGNLARAKVIVASGASWTLAKGLETRMKARGRR